MALAFCLKALFRLWCRKEELKQRPEAYQGRDYAQRIPEICTGVYLNLWPNTKQGIQDETLRGKAKNKQGSTS